MLPKKEDQEHDASIGKEILHLCLCLAVIYQPSQDGAKICHRASIGLGWLAFSGKDGTYIFL